MVASKFVTACLFIGVASSACAQAVSVQVSNATKHAAEVSHVNVSESAQQADTSVAVTAQTAHPQAPAMRPPSNMPGYLDKAIELDAEIELLNKMTSVKEAQKKLADSEDGLPSVKSVIIDANGPSAQIHYPSGMVRTVRVGDRVFGDEKVVEISESGVVIGARKKKRSLTFYEPPSNSMPMSRNDPRNATSFQSR